MNVERLQSIYAKYQKAAPVTARKGDVVELRIYGDIGGEVDTKALVAALAEPAKEVRLYVNSPGGSVFDAKAIYSAIERKVAGGTPVIAIIDGLAASAASFLVMACSRIEMASEATLMLHEAHGMMAGGDGTDFRAMADLLDKESESLARIYAKRTGKSPEEMRQLMKAETYLSAPEALSLGFVDAIVGEPAQLAALSTRFLTAAADTQRRIFRAAQASVTALRITREPPADRGGASPK